MVKRKKENKDVPSLLKDLESVSVFTKKTAVIDLAQKGAKEAVPDLIKLLKDREATLRGVSAWALGELMDKKASKALILCLKDMDVEVRRSAAQSLFKLSDPGTLAAVKDASVDSDKWVAEWAQKAVRAMTQEAPPRKAKKPKELLKLQS
jgi:HEAT repeat protein